MAIRCIFSRQPRQVYQEVCLHHKIKIVNKGRWDVYFPDYGKTFQQEMDQLQANNNHQLIAGIGGCHYMTSKRSLWVIQEKAYGRKKASELLPATYLIDEDHDRELLFSKFEKTKILLKGKQQKRKGLQLAHSWIDIKRAARKGNIIAQELLENIFSIDCHRLQLRMYLLLIAQNGLIKAYLYNNGKCLYSLNRDNMTLHDYIQTEQPFGDSPLPFSLLELRQHIKQDFKHLHLKIKNNLTSCLNGCLKYMGYQTNLWQNKTFQFFGVDYIMSPELKPFLLEINKGPSLKAKDGKDLRLKKELITDCFIQVGIINQRMSSEFEYLTEYQHKAFN